MISGKDRQTDLDKSLRRGEKRKRCTDEGAVNDDDSQSKIAENCPQQDKDPSISQDEDGNKHKWLPPPGVDSETFKQLCRERRKLASTRPKLFLTLDGVGEEKLRADSNGGEAKQEKPLLYMFDLQCLLLYTLLGHRTSFKPQWCQLLRVAKVPSVLLVVLEGVSFKDVDSHRDSCPFLWENFPMNVEMVAPAQYGSSAMDELFQVPLSAEKMRKQKAPKEALESVKGITSQLFGDFTPPASFSRQSLLLSTEQIAHEKYPSPLSAFPDKKQYVYTKEKYAPVHPNSPMFAVDCEMCVTVGGVIELTRVSIVNEELDVVYDTLVQPFNKITDYVTKYSGITAKMMRGVTTRLQDVQAFIRNFLPPDAILCGQSLGSDLKALKMFHPYVIDTSVIFNLSGNRGKKTGLKNLCKFFLGRSIQEGTQGHCSVEDAQATMELVLLKLSKGPDFGDMCAQPTTNDSSAEQTTANDKAASDKVANKALFLQQWRKAHSESVFPLISSLRKEVCLIDRQEELDKAVVSEDVVRQAVTADKEAIKIARQRLGHTNLVWLGLPEVSSSLLQNSADRPALLQAMDRKLQKLVGKVPEMGLAVVLMTGRASSGEGMQNAAAFLKLNCADLPLVPGSQIPTQDSG